MAQRPSYSVAPGDAGRSRILSWGALLGIAVLAVGALVLVFPKSDLMTLLRSESNQGNRDLSIAYLRSLIRTEPTDLDLQLLLVEKLLDGGDLPGARKALASALALAGTSPAGLDAWNRWDLAVWRARLDKAQSTGDTAESRAAATELIARLKRRASGTESVQGVFASIAAARDLQGALGVSGTALMGEAQAVQDLLLARLLALPRTTVDDLSRGGTMAVADGRFTLASELYFAARTKAVLPENRDKLLRQAVQALLAAGQPRAAWQAALRESQDLAPGDPTHWWLAELALGAGEPRQAGAALRRLWSGNIEAAMLAKTLTGQQTQLAWDIFLAAGDLPSALQVADAALLLQPQNTLWLERKAQTSEWAGLAPQALATWVVLMKMGPNERAMTNVFRLGPMLYDDEAVLAAWLVRSRQRRLTLAEVIKVVALHERLGSVDAALKFVQQLQATESPTDAAKLAQWLGIEAQLLERAGRPAEAIAILERLRPAGLSTTDAMGLAVMYLRKGQLPLALRALKSARVGGGEFNEAYWELLADLAYTLGDRALAQDALDKIIAQGKPQDFQAERAIRLRLDAGRFADATGLAAKLYQRFALDNIVYTWLDVVDAQKSAAGLRTLLSALKPAHRASLEKSPEFLSRRAALYVRLGDVPMARADYQLALQLQPGNREVRTAYLWLLVDQQDKTALQAEIRRVSRAEQANATYADVLIAAWQLLGEPLRALALMQTVARSHATDFLWLMSYADTLDKVGRQGAALRVRRHAWPLAQRAAGQGTGQEQGRQALMAQLRLAGDFASGSEKTRLWRQLGALLQTSQDPAQKQQAQELVGAWLLSQGHLDAARRWLWAQHAARMAVPSYQEFALAVAQNDTPALARLLEVADGAGGKPMEPGERLAALRLLKRRDEAVTVGSAQALVRPEGLDDEAQAALQEDLLATASRVSLQITPRQVGPLNRLEIRLDASLRLPAGNRLTANFNSGAYNSTDVNQIAATPSRDNELKLGLDTRTPWGDLKAQWLLRDALATSMGFTAQLTQPVGRHGTVQWEAAVGERSDESAAMSIAGLRDRATATLNLRLADRFDVQASLAKNHFRTQTGAALGASDVGTVAANWTLRQAYPDVRVKTQLTRSAVRADGQPDAGTAFLLPSGATPGVDLFLGPSSTAFSASVGLGLSASDATTYSRSWRPWGEFGFETRQTDAAAQTQGLVRLGVKGAVRGRDQLTLSLEVRPAAGGAAGAAGAVGAAGGFGSSELSLRYEVFFDR